MVAMLNESASVQSFDDAGGITEVVFSGLVTARDFERAANDPNKDVPACILVRMDKCLVLMDAPPVVWGGYYAPVGAIMCLPEQYWLWSEYAKTMAARGHLRAVFVVGHEPLARRWLAAQSFVAPSKSARLPREVRLRDQSGRSIHRITRQAPALQA